MRYGLKNTFRILAILTIGIYLYMGRVGIVKIGLLSHFGLPADLQLLLSDTKSELMFIRFNGSKLQYYYNGANYGRCSIIIKTMQRLTLPFKYSLLPGDYIISLHDGVHNKYPWPVLAFASTAALINNRDVVLIPDPEALLGYTNIFRDVDKAVYNNPWYSKTPKIFWRGSATGAGQENNDLNGTPRLRFINYASKLDFADVGITSYTQQLNPKFKQLLASVHSLQPKVSVTDSINYKYLIDIDGNSCSYSRMAWILYSNSLLMKHASIYKQWYYDQMLPYVHYLPVAADFSNLEEQYLWAEMHPDAAQGIALNGRNFAKHIFNEGNVLDAFEEGILKYNLLRPFNITPLKLQQTKAT